MESWMRSGFLDHPDLYLVLWTFLCWLSPLSDVKHLLHSVHEYCPPVCFIVWTFKFVFVVNLFSHTVQTYSLGLTPPEWTVTSFLWASVSESIEVSACTQNHIYSCELILKGQMRRHAASTTFATFCTLVLTTMNILVATQCTQWCKTFITFTHECCPPVCFIVWTLKFLFVVNLLSHTLYRNTALDSVPPEWTVTSFLWASVSGSTELSIPLLYINALDNHNKHTASHLHVDVLVS